MGGADDKDKDTRRGKYRTSDIRSEWTRLSASTYLHPLLFFRLGLLALIVFLPSALLLGYSPEEREPSLLLRLLASVSGVVSFLAFWQAAFTFRVRTLYGSARWDSPEARREWRLVPLCRLFTPKAHLRGSFFVGVSGGSAVLLDPELSYQHGIILGGTGSGKTRGFFLPNAARLSGASLVATDPKSELWDYTAGIYPCARRFAPLEPEKSCGFNWIPLCRDARYAEICARALIESGESGPQRTEAIWIEAESAFLAALFAHAATLPEPTPLTAYRLFTRQEQSALIAQLKGSASEVAREQAFIFEQTQERMRGSIVPAVAAKLQFLRDERIARFTSATLEAPDFGRMRREPQALYWVLPEQDMVRLRPLTSVFFTLLLEQIARVPLPSLGKSVPIVALLDEFGNIGNLPAFDSTISLARSRGITFWLGLHSLSQLEDRYGTAAGETILANCGTKIALAGLEGRTALYISRLLGQTTVSTARRSFSLRGLFGQVISANHQRTDTERALLTPDEVRRIGRDQALVVAANLSPLLLSKFWYDKAPKGQEEKALGPALSSALPDAPKGQETPPGRTPRSSRLSRPPMFPETLLGPFPPRQQTPPEDPPLTQNIGRPIFYSLSPPKERAPVRVRSESTPPRNPRSWGYRGKKR